MLENVWKNFRKQMEVFWQVLGDVWKIPPGGRGPDGGAFVCTVVPPLGLNSSFISMRCSVVVVCCRWAADTFMRWRSIP